MRPYQCRSPALSAARRPHRPVRSSCRCRWKTFGRIFVSSHPSVAICVPYAVDHLSDLQKSRPFRRLQPLMEGWTNTYRSPNRANSRHHPVTCAPSPQTEFPSIAPARRVPSRAAPPRRRCNVTEEEHASSRRNRIAIRFSTAAAFGTGFGSVTFFFTHDSRTLGAQQIPRNALRRDAPGLSSSTSSPAFKSTPFAYSCSLRGVAHQCISSRLQPRKSASGSRNSFHAA